MKQFFSKYFKYFVLAALLYIPIFGYLETLALRIWDESRPAVNAYEMLKNNNFIVTHYEGAPDMWQTKPPLLIWLQVICMKTLGVSELAVRLPSAIAAFLTCAALIVFSLRYLKNFWFGFIAVIVLITSQGYISIHGTRTGDYDSLLTLFTTLSGLFFFAYCETAKAKHLYLFFASAALAVLTKGVAGILFFPALAIYCTLRKRLLPILMTKHFYIGLASFIAVAAGYYFLRELQNPGYMHVVYMNELGGRYMDVVEGHQHGFWFYNNNLYDSHFTTWYLLVLCGVVLGLFSKSAKIQRITIFSILMVFTYLLIISVSQTKLPWYDLPLYPYLAILVAVFIYFIFDWLKEQEWNSMALKVNIVPFVFLFLVAIIPYKEIIAKTYMPQEELAWPNEYSEMVYYLRNAGKGNHDLNNKYLLYDGYYAHNLFYIYVLNEQGVNISFKDWTKLEGGDTVFSHHAHVKQYVEDHYNHEVLSTEGNIVTYKILERKQ